MSRPLVWITGAGGLIGSHLVNSAGVLAPGWRVEVLTRRRLDLTDFVAVARAFAGQRPSLVIHCAALSRGTACAANPALAERVNVSATRHLCELAEAIPFVFFSTDLVFDGRQGRYVETDPPNPLSVYAETKARAEAIVLRNPRHTVLRTSLNTGVSPTGDKSFTEQMRRAWQRGDTLRLFTDEFRSPIPAAVTARAVWELAQRNQPGLYHLAGGERLSRWEIGRLLARRWPELHPRLERASIKDFTGPPRAADTSLNCAKLQQLLSFPLPGLGQWLQENPHRPV
jgi:dTDP-4-dehydrorhamnose reductase